MDCINKGEMRKAETTPSMCLKERENLIQGIRYAGAGRDEMPKEKSEAAQRFTTATTTCRLEGQGEEEVLPALRVMEEAGVTAGLSCTSWNHKANTAAAPSYVPPGAPMG